MPACHHNIIDKLLRARKFRGGRSSVFGKSPVIINSTHFPAYLVLRTICDELGVIKYKWFEIGVMLGIPRGKLMEFRKEDDPLAAAVDYWLNGNVKSVPLSWRSIVKAVESGHVGETGLAKRISKKYCQQQGNKEGKGETLSNHARGKFSGD